ncbi:MAG: 8-amino-7-oxononanoate synthase [Luteolibacter sp.]
MTPAESLSRLAAEGLLRTTRPLDSPSGVQVVRNGKTLWNFASNDYLGLARHPRIEAALIEGVRQYGAGSAASRLVCGTLPPHQRLEESLAAAKQTEAALTFSSGFATALGTITAVCGKEDTIILDKLSHASLVDAARLSGATLRIFPHNDLEKLGRLLKSSREKSPAARILIATESVFSMDGDTCPLAEILTLAEQYDALLLLDEAHGFGVLGENGMGLAEALGLQHRVTFQMGTLSKAVGLSGGYLAASRDWIDLILNRARSFIYSTAPPPCLAHAATEALALIRSEEGKKLRENLRRNLSLLEPAKLTPIHPVILGTNESVLQASADLEAHGFLVPAIRYPTVPRGTARLRISVSAVHPQEAIQQLVANLTSVQPT